jgi:hypothetical protein
MGERESTLNELFLSAKNKQEQLELFDPRSDDFDQTQRSAIKALEDCRELIAQIALYSTNEEVDDISTQNLQ